METIVPSVTKEEFALLVRHAGLPLDPPQQAVLYAIYGNFEAMLNRVRSPADRARGAEPAHVFMPGQEWPQA